MGWIADLLQEIPSAARYKSELEAMEKKVVSLEAENVNLRQEIHRRDDIVQKQETQSHKIPLNKFELTIMVAIASSEYQTLMEHDLATITELKATELKYHLHELEENGYIENQHAYFSLTQKGSKLLLNNNFA